MLTAQQKYRQHRELLLRYKKHSCDEHVLATND